MHWLVEMTRLQARDAPEKCAKELFAVEPAWRTLSMDKILASDPGFKSAGVDYRNLLADTSATVAGQYLKVNNAEKYRLFIDRAVEAKHATKHATFAVGRALGYKQHAAAMRATAEDLTVVRRQAVAAIAETPAAQRPGLQKQLDAGWPP